jgi:hypothetical protein
MTDHEGRLHRLVMNRKGTDIRDDRVIYRADRGLRDVSKGPGGYLFFMNDRAIYRIVPE